jgi:hypothetical protein
MRYKQDQENQRIKDEEILFPTHTSTETTKVGKQNGENGEKRETGNPSGSSTGESKNNKVKQGQESQPNSTPTQHKGGNSPR